MNISNLSNTPRLRPVLDEISTAIGQKLWHELICASLTLALDPDFTNTKLLWDNVIAPHAKHVNSRQLARLAIITAHNTESVAFLENVLRMKEFKENDKLLLRLSCCEFKLHTGIDCTRELKQIEATMEEKERDTHLMALLYRVQSVSAALRESYQQYFTASLLYLACETSLHASATPNNLFSQQEARGDLGLGGKEDDKVSRAYGLALAALLSSELYNFGQLMLHPILQQLKPSHAWLVGLVEAFNEGDLKKFNELKGQVEVSKEPQLVKNMTRLEEKIRLMALIESVFSRSNEERAAMTFVDISRNTSVPLEQVEYLVMRALALGLLKGKMDGVNGTLSCSWISPRVLSPKQRENLSRRLAEWQKKILNTSQTIQQAGADILVN